MWTQFIEKVSFSELEHIPVECKTFDGDIHI
jgi:hypothetical protein